MTDGLADANSLESTGALPWLGDCMGAVMGLTMAVKEEGVLLGRAKL